MSPFFYCQSSGDKTEDFSMCSNDSNAIALVLGTCMLIIYLCFGMFHVYLNVEY